jgi:hypothetical protein
MKVTTWWSALAAAGIVVTLAGVSQGQSPAPDSEASRIFRGYQIARSRASFRKASWSRI